MTQEIPEELAGKRLDQALARMFPEYSRSRLKAWILDKRIDVDGELLRPRDLVDAQCYVNGVPSTQFNQHDPASSAIALTTPGLTADSALLEVEGRTAREILGTPDDLKLHSSATLFALADEADPLFSRLLQRYFSGRFDPATRRLLG